MEKELEDLSSTLLSIYEKNLVFLKENFEDIFNRVNTLSDDINSENIKEKYTLEYRDGYFDILNNETNSWFYGISSYDDADNRAKNSNFTKDGSLDLLRKGIDGKKLIGNSSYKDVLPILDYINDNVDLENIEFRKIYKFVFMGVGLGIHLHEMNKKLDPFTTLIIEPELEIFRLSLFITDYSVFEEGNKKLFLSIEDDKLDRQYMIEQFYKYHNYMNYNIKHHLLIQNYGYLKDELVDYFANNAVGYFPYSLIINNIQRTVNFVKIKSKFIDTQLVLDQKILKDQQVLIIAAGPSLDNYIDWIEEHQDKFTIVCVDVILRKLEKHNIVPDIVVSIDPSEMCAKYLTTEDPEFLKDSTIVFLSQQEKSVLKIVKDKKFYVAQSIVLFEELGFLGTVNNVGTYSFMIATHFGANNIYTIGTDAAFDQETGSRYSKDSSYTQTENISLENNSNNIVSTTDVIEVAGNLREIVKTNRSLLTFKESFEGTFYNLKNHYEFKVYNLSDGVKLEGFEPMTYKEINNKVESFKNKDVNIQAQMDSISRVMDMPDFDNDIKILNRILSKVKKHKNIKIKNRDDFLEKKLDIMLWILEQSKTMSSSLFGNIFLLYTELADIYINFVLNLKDKNIDNIDNLKKINNIWIDGIISVLKDIKKAVN
jgi:hypothetical protein